jgi:hypothetical protein
VDLARQAFALGDDDVLRVLSRLDTGVVDAEPGAKTGGQIGGAGKGARRPIPVCQQRRPGRAGGDGAARLQQVARVATAKLDVKRAGERGDRRGSVPVTWTDYGVTPPDFAGLVKVRPTGTIEFLVSFTKK